MKLLVVLGSLTALCVSSAILVPRDNSHYVPGKSSYVWMPDGDEGALVLVDLHAPVEESDTSRGGMFNQYRLFTRNNRNNYQLLIHGNTNSIRNSNFNGNLPTLVIAHGWRSSGGSAWVTQIKNAYLDWTNGNVIVVDWSTEAGDINYVAVARLVPAVGQRTKQVLNFIITTSGSNWNRFHLIGHSLGAHVMGTAGRAPGGRPDRVTGLDPAGPQFGKFMANSLGTDSGTYVESIHTQRGIGIGIDISHADFFPNGGNNQPGCNLNYSLLPSVGPTWWEDVAVAFSKRTTGNALVPPLSLVQPTWANEDLEFTGSIHEPVGHSKQL